MSVENKKKQKKKWLKTLIYISAGAFGGFLYYYFVGCAAGTCALASNPYITTAMFGFVGWLLSGIFEKEDKNKCNT